MTHAAPTLEVDNLGLTYSASSRQVEALRSLSLSITDGQFISIVGPSGCGKSTLLKIIYGLMSPTSGTASICGSALTGPRRDVGMVFQTPVLLPWLTILENALLPAVILHLDRNAMRERALQLLSMTGLAGFENVYPHELSGGMQQRVAIVRALLHDPNLLLMDEPFAALDALTREQMALELQRIWMTSGKTVLFVTHSIPEAVLLSDRVVLLSARPGRVIDVFDTPRERPRSFDDLSSPHFAELSKLIRRGLNEATSNMAS